MATNEVAMALSSLVAAHMRAVAALEQDPAMLKRLNGDLGHFYPYHVSFDDLLIGVGLWADAMERAAKSQSADEINRALDHFPKPQRTAGWGVIIQNYDGDDLIRPGFPTQEAAAAWANALDEHSDQVGGPYRARPVEVWEDDRHAE